LPMAMASYFIAAISLISASPLVRNENVPVNMSVVSEPVFNNLTFLGNTYTALGVISEAVAQDVLWKIRAVSGRNNMPYLLQGQLTIGLGATLVMQPGVVVKNTGGGSILIQRAFQSEGRTEPDSLVVFTSYRDDTYGGDTNNDGAATVPAQSDWNYITVDGTAIDPQVRFKNTLFRYGGSGTTTGVLRCVNSSPTADSCMFMYNAVGVSVEGASNPTLRGCSFVSNVNYGVNNTGNSFCVNAEGSWWGAASGPNDNSATADLCGLGLNAGSGDRVSNNVDYAPFATSGILNPLLGDVSLNGQVLAYDASLVLQYVVSLISLSPLQQLVAEVSGTGGISAFDATLILQYVAGIIPAFPANTNLNFAPEADRMRARAAIAALSGDAQVSLLAPERDGAGWRVPVRVSGTSAFQSLELRLEGVAAGRLSGITTATEGALAAHRADGARAFAAIASVASLGHDVVAWLRFDGDDSPADLRLAWSRVNESESGPASVIPTAARTTIAAPGPNPASFETRVRVELAAADAGVAATMRVYDLAGRLVRRVETPPLAAGVHQVAWNLTDEHGARVPAGVYLVRVAAGARQSVHRLVVVR